MLLSGILVVVMLYLGAQVARTPYVQRVDSIPNPNQLGPPPPPSLILFDYTDVFDCISHTILLLSMFAGVVLCIPDYEIDGNALSIVVLVLNFCFVAMVLPPYLKLKLNILRASDLLRYLC